MDRPVVCPDCGSEEIAESVRVTSLYGEIRVIVCRACDWSPDTRIGKPAADRSKNVGLRRRLGVGHSESPATDVVTSHTDD
jgi:hypothetical protein